MIIKSKKTNKSSVILDYDWDRLDRGIKDNFIVLAAPLQSAEFRQIVYSPLSAKFNKIAKSSYISEKNKKGITVIYLLRNRLEYTIKTLPVVIEECKNSNVVKELIVFDDCSKEDTTQYLQSLNIEEKLGKKYKYLRRVFYSSCIQINYCISTVNTEYLYKIDNDIIIPKGSFDYMYNIMENNKDITIAAMRESGLGCSIKDSSFTSAAHVGGVGIFRLFEFKSKIKTYARFFGFTFYQFGLKGKKVWVNAENFNLDSGVDSKRDQYKKSGDGR